jgi:hypothetical protein
MPQDKSEAFLLTQVRQPLPGEHAFDPYHQLVSIGSADA